MPPSTPPHISTSVKPYDRPAQVSSPTAPVPYIFDFGLQKGEPFSSISASTLNWIFRSFYYRKKPALKAALISHGFMNPDGSRTSKRPPPTPRKKKDAVPLLVPDTIPARNPNKAYTMQGGQDIWITRRAVDEHFGVSAVPRRAVNRDERVSDRPYRSRSSPRSDPTRFDKLDSM